MSGIRKLTIGLVIGVAALANAERYKVHKDAGRYGICIRRAQNDSNPCNGDLAEQAVLISADEVDALVQSARDYCKDRLDPQTMQLRADLRALSDANDALSKRVSDLEAKLNALGKPAPKKP